jgi:hypothetical protein
MTTPGKPAKVKPETSNGHSELSERQCSPAWYHVPGMPTPRCGSLASSGLPVLDFSGPTTQEFEPTPSPRPRVAGTAASARCTAAYARSASLEVSSAGTAVGVGAALAGAALAGGCPVEAPASAPGMAELAWPGLQSWGLRIGWFFENG